MLNTVFRGLGAKGRDVSVGGVFLAATLAFSPWQSSHAQALDYPAWVSAHALPPAASAPVDNPDQDAFTNVLEYAFGTDPLVADNTAATGPRIEIAPVAGNFYFTYRESHVAQGRATYTIVSSTDLQNWSEVTPVATSRTADSGFDSVRAEIASIGEKRFFRLRVVAETGGEVPEMVEVGAEVGEGYWEGLDVLAEAYVRTVAPPVSTTDTTPNNTKYPEVIATSLVAATPELLADYDGQAKRLPRRSWMGWFLWANGTPPPGIKPGIPVSGEYDGGDWDFFSYQFPAGENTEPVAGWKPIRLDQQPLYLNPFRINYAWPPGAFGYETQPLKHFPNETTYWQDKKIVRGVNLSLAYPFFHQYGNYVAAGDTPDVWRESWLYQRTRPLETVVIVPGNLRPDEILANGGWNNNGSTEAPSYQPFPYPVWDETLPPAQQTPFAILTDRIGDWDADIVWEGTNPRATSYEQNRYRRSAYNQAGQGNYLKMTVAQGSPFIWAESHCNKYVTFYNLIRTNLPGQIDNNTGSGAKVVEGGPWPVPGVSDVEYVLLYGDHNNPNQWYHEVAPWFYDAVNQKAGGFNPAGKQHNHIYVAVFYRKSAAQSVNLEANSGTDAQGNPYFFLEFNNDAKNWFVVGTVPVFRYYHTGVTQDGEAARVQAARQWAEKMGGYAFNFLQSTKVSYAVQNVNEVSTDYVMQVQNPYVAAGDATATGMTLNNSDTVLALLPHQYQPLTLGPDLTRADRREVVWEPLEQSGTDFTISNPPANANRSRPGADSLWGYWGPRGNMKTIIGSSFKTRYPFQNFLPINPPPAWEREYVQTGVQIVRVTDVGSGNHRIDTVPTASIESPAGGSGAELKVILEPNTGRVMQIDVTKGGSGYPDGNPPENVTVRIDAPPINSGVQATARAQIGGGKVLAVFMNEKGSGYASTIEATQEDVAYDPAIIVPPFDEAGNLIVGNATIVSGGAGFNFLNGNAPTLTFEGTGSGAQVELVTPGSLSSVGPSGIGGFTSGGSYPRSGDNAADLAAVRALVPPPVAGQSAQEISGADINYQSGLIIALTDSGEGYTGTPTASITFGESSVYNMNVNMANGQVASLELPAGQPLLTTPTEVEFVGGSPARPAKATAYGMFSIDGAKLAGASVSGYEDSVQVDFEPIILLPEGVTLPEFSYTINAGGQITDVQVVNAGGGFTSPGFFEIRGGRGADAAMLPVLDEHGGIASVQVLRQGNNYPAQVYANILEPHTAAANLKVVVDGGHVVAVEVLEAGAGYINPVIHLTGVQGGDPEAQPAKGPYASINYSVSGGGIGVVVIGNAGAGYIQGTETESLPEATKTWIQYKGTLPFASSLSSAKGFVAQAVPASRSVKQVVYDSLITEFTNYGSSALKPFGGGFGGSSGPDGYGLGNQLSAAAKVLGLLFHFQHHYAQEGMDLPDVAASGFARLAGETPANAYEFPIYRTHNPLFTLGGALKTGVQALQRTLSLFHQDPPYTNKPAVTDWQMQYFAAYDKNAGRVVINPSATIPVKGVVSSIPNPPVIPASENQGKQGLNIWEEGMLWSGFGVSDQWNDQHYFFGYYLGAAALSAILDRSWEEAISARPDNLWADADQMGTAIDQWLMTLAYDPDNPALVSALHHVPEFTYQKFAFFDQWSGHGWATGVSPGRAGDVEGNVPWSLWHSYGTGNGSYDDENENSIFEGLQAWSAVILWGGGTDRKAVVDLGIYLLATELAAGDVYFLDKNYNLPNTDANQYSWVPVTTIPSSELPPPFNGGNNDIAVNSGFVEATPSAFYVAPEIFGGAASSGTSILHKGSPSLNNFFYAFPTGSKFIQAFPPSPWTLGISRNSDYMKRWAGAMMRPEWQAARESSLYQAANWLSMSMASAVSGVPYNPGDVPYPLIGGDAADPEVLPYVDRIWSSWLTLDNAAGYNAAIQPAFRPITVMSFMHTLQEYGTADWTYIAEATDSSGQPANDVIVFTAAFSKMLDANTVRTTFVAFNPGWQTRYASFYRLGADGERDTATVDASMPLEVPAKRMIFLQKDFTVN